MFGYQFPRCNNDTGYDSDKLISPDALDRFCQGLASKDAEVLKGLLLEPSDPMKINTGYERNFQSVFLNDLATTLNHVFAHLSGPFHGFGEMKCRAATRESLHSLLQEDVPGKIST